MEKTAASIQRTTFLSNNTSASLLNYGSQSSCVSISATLEVTQDQGLDVELPLQVDLVKSKHALAHNAPGQCLRQS